MYDAFASLNVVDLKVQDDLTVTDDASIGGVLTVTGATALNGADVTLADGVDLITASAGTSNLRIGVNAGNSITSNGNENVLVGDEAGTALTTGDDNVAIGYRALSTEDTGTRSVAIGHDALRVQNNDSTNYNVAVGFAAGEAVTTGVQNTIIGAFKQVMPLPQEIVMWHLDMGLLALILHLIEIQQLENFLY